MPITSTTTSIVHTGNSLTTAFPYDFLIPDAESAVVTLISVATGARQTIPSSDYTVSGVGESDGGTVTYTILGVPITAANKLQIDRVVPATQLVNITNFSSYFPNVVVGVWDKLTMLAQQGISTSLAALRAPIGEAITELPDATQRVGKYVTFDSSGNPILVSGTLSGDVLRAARVPDGETLSELPSAVLRANKIMSFDPTGEIGVSALPQDLGVVIRADKGWQTLDFATKGLSDWTSSKGHHWLTGRDGAWSQPVVTNLSTGQSFPEVNNYGPVFQTDAYTEGFSGAVIYNLHEIRKLFLGRVRFRVNSDNADISLHRIRVSVIAYDESFVELGTTEILSLSEKTVADGWVESLCPFWSDHQSGGVFHRIKIDFGQPTVASTETYQLHEFRVKEVSTLNALDWGARAEGGGGNAFNNAPIHAAMLDFIRQNPGAPNVMHWPGNEYTYKFDQSMECADIEFFGITGDGRFQTTFYFSENCNDDCVHLRGTVDNTSILSECFFANFTVEGADHIRQSSGNNAAIRLDESIQCSLLNLHLRQTGRGIHLDEDSAAQSPNKAGSSRHTISNCVINQNYFPNGANGTPLFGLHFDNTQGTADKGQNVHGSDMTIYSKLAGVNDEEFDGTGSASTWYEMDISNGLANSGGIWVYEFVDGMWVQQNHVAGEYVLQIGLDFDAASDVNTGTNRLTLLDHEASDDDEIVFSAQAGATLPSPLSDATTYYVLNANEDDFQVSLIPGGAAVSITATGTGTCNVWQTVVHSTNARSAELSWDNGENVERIRVQSVAGFASGSGNVAVYKRDTFGSVGLYIPKGSGNSFLSQSIGGYEVCAQTGDGTNDADSNRIEIVYAQIANRVFKTKGTKNVHTILECVEYAEGQIEQYEEHDGGVSHLVIDANALPTADIEVETSSVPISGPTVIHSHSIANFRPGTHRQIIATATYNAVNNAGGDVEILFTLQWRVSGNAAWETLDEVTVRSNVTGATANHIKGKLTMPFEHQVGINNTKNVTKTLQYRLLGEDITATAFTIAGGGNAGCSIVIRAVNP